MNQILKTYMTTSEFSYQFKKHQNELLRFAVKLTYSQADAQDVLQEASITAYRKRSMLDNAEKFKSWMSTILYNTFINGYRSRKRRKTLLEEKKGVDGYFFNKEKVNNQGYETLLAQDIKHLTKKVGKNSMETFLLYLKGYSYKEISADKDIAVGTVKSRIHFARTKLRTMINSMNKLKEVA